VVVGKVRSAGCFTRRHRHHTAFCSYRADGLIIATPLLDRVRAVRRRPIVYPTWARSCSRQSVAYADQPARGVPDTFEIEIHVKAPDHDTTFTVDGQIVATGPTT